MMFKVGDKVMDSVGNIRRVRNVDNASMKLKVEGSHILWDFCQVKNAPETNAERFPKAYNRLMTMPGVTEEERRICIEDFLQLDPDDDQVDLYDSEHISSMFKWKMSSMGHKFWNQINEKVLNAKRKQKEQEERADRIKSELDAAWSQENYLPGLPDTILYPTDKSPSSFLQDYTKRSGFHTNELGMRVRPFVRSKEEPRNEWPTQKDIDELCGVWRRGNNNKHIHEYSLRFFLSRYEFCKWHDEYERIEPMPQDKPKQRDAETLRALENYPSNRDTEMEWTDRRVK